MRRKRRQTWCIVVRGVLRVKRNFVESGTVVLEAGTSTLDWFAAIPSPSEVVSNCTVELPALHAECALIGKPTG
jgi:hypothetical protein